MSLLSTGPLVIAVILAIAVPLAATYWWAWHRTPGRPRLVTVVALLVAFVCAQATAVGAVGLAVNNHYQFYTSIGDVLGSASDGGSPIVINRAAGADGGRLETITVHGRASHTTEPVLVWLPRQYGEPAYRHHRFPVVEFLPGQPSYPGADFADFDIGGRATAAIAQGMKPFVVVVPPIMVRPPEDTECTNVPHGIRALSWLTHDVPDALTHDLRVQRPGRHWSVLGWSTGGFCAAKLLLTKPREFSAAVSFGGYYQATAQGAVPNLFGASRHVRKENSPVWLYNHRNGLDGDRLLMITGRQDPWSWPATRKMIRTTAGDDHVDYVAFPTGGHNVHDYAAYLPAALRWLQQSGSV